MAAPRWWSTGRSPGWETWADVEAGITTNCLQQYDVWTATAVSLQPRIVQRSQYKYLLALTGACVYGSCSVLLSIIMSSLFNLTGLHQEVQYSRCSFQPWTRPWLPPRQRPGQPCSAWSGVRVSPGYEHGGRCRRAELEGRSRSVWHSSSEMVDSLPGNSHRKAPALMVALNRELSGALLPLVLESHANIPSVSARQRMRMITRPCSHLMVGTKQHPLEWFPLQKFSPPLKNTSSSWETRRSVDWWRELEHTSRWESTHVYWRGPDHTWKK